MVKKRGNKQGFSLIEMMIALLIALFMVGGVLTLFGGVSRLYNTTSAAALTQENGRFALAELSQTIMRANFFGNLSRPTLQVSNVAVDGGEVDCGQTWLRRLSQPVYGYDRPTAGHLNCIPTGADQSDMIVLRMTESNPTPAASRVAGQAYLYSNLSHGRLFQMGVEADPAAISGGEYWAISGIVYYVKDNPEGIPALYRFDAATGTDQDVVQGVESMQIRYGVKSAAGTFVSQYLSAAALSDWNAVISVRVDLLVRSKNFDSSYASGSACKGGPSYTLGTYDYLVPDLPPRCYRRRVFTTIIQLRNNFIRF
ncbi:MAG: PilW family protein [Magnetococcales bacterium]|nr:PilW family protein [Magnetococcales bacterium]